MAAMFDGLLQTKLFVPATRAALVERPQLIKQINDGLQGKLVLVSAPAGYGKTSLVTAWINQLDDGMSVRWLSLDGDDSQPRQFFSYLAAALQPIIGEEASFIRQLQSPQLAPSKNLMAALINDSAAVSVPFCLVLDDYHTIDSLEIDQAIAFLLDNMPAAMTLIMTSRTDPGFPLSKLRVRGELVEIRAKDLRFSTAEAAQFLQDNMNLSLSAEQIGALEARTEGWVAGLQMAALSLRGRQDAAAFVDAFAGSHRFVLDYLVEEVLINQPKEIRQFLLQTSILDRVSGSLCDAITEQTNGKEILSQLEHDNMFVIALDDDRRWYRYHHLFAEMLRARLQEEAPDQATSLHQRASNWFERSGAMPDAVRHATAAEDWDRLARLLDIVWRDMDISLQNDRWMSWAQPLPSRYVNNRPVLAVGFAWGHITVGEFEKGAVYLEVAERWVGTDYKTGEMIVFDREEFKYLPVTIASARAYMAQAMGDVQGTINHAEHALALLPEDNYLRRVIPNSLLSLVYWASGELSAAYDALASGMRGFAEIDQIMAAISGVFLMADVRVTQGRLDQAQQTYQDALNYIADKGAPNTRGAEVSLLGLSELHRMRGELDTAAEFLQKAEELGIRSVEPLYYWRHNVAMAQLKSEIGALDEALDLLDAAAAAWADIHIPTVQPIGAMKARVWSKQGQLGKALRWVKDRELSVEDELSFIQEFEHLTLVRILIAQSQQDQSRAILEQAALFLFRLEEAAEEGGRMGSLLEILILQAIVHHAAGDEGAIDFFKKSIALAEPQGVVRPFVAEGAPIEDLLKQIAGLNNEHKAYATKLLAAFKTPSSKASETPTGTGGLLDPLSERELDVLRLLTTEMSGPAIADELMVSLNTLRTHTKNIYSKLGANSRRTAVRKAEELNLV
ncbi:MAG: LuxR C-terminal-related transcriptional regulator [Chloroflexota bacterium]